MSPVWGWTGFAGSASPTSLARGAAGAAGSQQHASLRTEFGSFLGPLLQGSGVDGADAGLGGENLMGNSAFQQVE